MYHYIVNPAAGSGTVDSIQSKLKTNLDKLGISGRFSKTLGPDDVRKVTRGALRQGAKTIVAVGGDKTVNEVLEAVRDDGATDVAIGVIPVGNKNVLARYLGIQSWKQACEILAARRLRTYRLSRLNEHFFVVSCTVEGSSSTFDYLASIDNDYKLRGAALSINVHNQRLLNESLDNGLVARFYDANIENGSLFAWLRSLLPSRGTSPEYSQLHADTLRLESPEPLQIELDGRTIESKTARITLDDHDLRLITNRQNGHRGPIGV